MSTFADLKLTKPILNALEDAGFETPTPIQEQIFSIAKSGQEDTHATPSN